MLSAENTKSWLFKRNMDRSARFILGKKGDNPLVCFVASPSCASPARLDNTETRVERFAHKNGYDSWIILSLYPQISKSPNDLEYGMDEALHRQNKKVISEILKGQNLNLWAAWGRSFESRKYFSKCLIEINNLVNTAGSSECSDSNCNWISLGSLTKQGHPRHPLYMPYDAQPERFDVEDYLKNISSQVILLKPKNK